MQQFNIETVINEFMFEPEELAHKYGYIIMVGENITHVNTRHNVINFGNGRFLGSFIYYKNKLMRIILIPKIENYVVPNYPCEKYQKIKQQYCIEVLKTLYGDDYTLVDGGMKWTTDKYYIGSYAITEGRDRYTDGNITIDIR